MVRAARVERFTVVIRLAPRWTRLGHVSTIDRLASWIGEVLAHHMLEVSTDPVVVLNADQRIVLASRSVSSLEWTSARLVGREWRELLHPGDARQRPAPHELDDLHAGGASRDVAVRSGDGGWREMVETSYSAEIDGHGTVSVIVLRPRHVVA